VLLVRNWFRRQVMAYLTCLLFSIAIIITSMKKSWSCLRWFWFEISFCSLSVSQEISMIRSFLKRLRFVFVSHRHLHHDWWDFDTRVNQNVWAFNNIFIFTLKFPKNRTFYSFNKKSKGCRNVTHFKEFAWHLAVQYENHHHQSL